MGYTLISHYDIFIDNQRLKLMMTNRLFINELLKLIKYE